MNTQPEPLRLADRLNAWPDAEELDDAAAELRRLHYERERLIIEREHARIMYEHSVELLISIHSLLYPPATKLPDGRTMVFRPKDPDPHTILQALSDRIRALPDEIAAFAKAESEKKSPGVL